MTTAWWTNPGSEMAGFSRNGRSHGPNKNEQKVMRGGAPRTAVRPEPWGRGFRFSKRCGSTWSSWTPMARSSTKENRPAADRRGDLQRGVPRPVRPGDFRFQREGHRGRGPAFAGQPMRGQVRRAHLRGRRGNLRRADQMPDGAGVFAGALGARGLKARPALNAFGENFSGACPGRSGAWGRSGSERTGRGSPAASPAGR